MTTREEGKRLVQILVERFRLNHREYARTNSPYNETQLRNDFLNPFLRALGWDVFNENQASQSLREVVQEDTVEVDVEEQVIPKKPDYSLRLAGKRKFFLEAKKPAVPITTDKASAFQVRRYGWNARMAVSVLSNFDNLIIYDCQPRPKAGDDARIARLKSYSFEEYVAKFDEIYDELSRETIYSGRFDAVFPLGEEKVGKERFDQYFLGQIEEWRKRLAADLLARNPAITSEELKFLVQRLLNRIIFLRICEDRELEKYKELAEVETYGDLKDLFVKADERYNSGLFDFLEDRLSLNVQVGSEVLIEIFRELYYPQSPYAFSVVDASVLGDIYEEFLAKEIRVAADGSVEIVEKPEVLESRGVVPTPDFVVETIIQRTLDSLCQGKSPDELLRIRITDITCGSGTLLLAAYQYLLNYHLEWYVRDGPEKHPDKIFEMSGGQYQLALSEKQRILLNNIYGVDIDIQAVEVTRFSLLLKVLEGESAASIASNLENHNNRALPNLDGNIQCGNSLVDSRYFEFDQEAALSSAEVAQINPLDWSPAFAEVMEEGGFDVVVGNPPYIRIQNMVKYSPKEVRYYQSNVSPYTTAKTNNFDKYLSVHRTGINALEALWIARLHCPEQVLYHQGGNFAPETDFRRPRATLDCRFWRSAGIWKKDDNLYRHSHLEEKRG